MFILPTEASVLQLLLIMILWHHVKAMTRQRNFKLFGFVATTLYIFES